VLLWVGVPAGIAAMLSLGFTILITGAMHEDGLADCADGFWGGWTRERRL
jgi:adenosylcobinamide-GDP ribazoletransferase